MVNFGPLTAKIGSGIWGTPANFNGFRVLAALLHGTLVVGVSQTAALIRGRHLYSAGRPSRWALAHILVAFILAYKNVQKSCAQGLWAAASWLFSSPCLRPSILELQLKRSRCRERRTAVRNVVSRGPSLEYWESIDVRSVSLVRYWAAIGGHACNTYAILVADRSEAGRRPAAS